MTAVASSMPTNPMLMNLGPTEILLILGVLVLLFGAKKLPELARGSGRALRIFKSETKGLLDEPNTIQDNAATSTRPRTLEPPLPPDREPSPQEVRSADPSLN